VTALLSRPNELLRTTLVVGEEGILAHVSAVRAYQRTWILQHLAALPGERATIGRGRIMNLAIIQYLEQLPDIEWAKIWFRPQSPWPARVFGRFARRVEDPRRSCLRTYTYMTAGPGDLPDSPGPATLTIRAAAADDLAAVEAYFVRHGSAVLQAADDLTRDALTLEPVRAAYAELDLDRRREVLVAERRGRLVGFALLEMSSKGLNFSELTNTFRIFAEHADPEVSTELARAARARYASSGRSHCFGLAAEGEVAAFEAAGFTGSRQYACWTWHRSLYLDFCEHVLRLRV
jgi:L-amino acid N-acyltransferase YncA